eukprot:1501242-Prymnesium_polylepis.1
MVLQFLPSALKAIDAMAKRSNPHPYFEMRGKANRARRASRSATKRAAMPSRSPMSCQAMTTPPASPIRDRKELECSG